MAENKNQHFVPKTYLKPFSIAGDGHGIHVFNLGRMRSIPSAGVRGQCSRPYFYGKDPRLERAIQLIETSYGRCVADLAETDGELNAMHEIVLRRFAYHQHLRTEAVAEASARSAIELANINGADLLVPSFKEAVQSGVQAAMLHFADQMKLVDDLRLRIVQNRSSMPFITSDNPSVLAKRWHQQQAWRTRDLRFGSASAGAIFLLPLTPRLLALMYDGDVYTCAHTGGRIEVEDPCDIDSLNAHQALNCSANLYFDDWKDHQHVAACAAANAAQRPAHRSEFTFAVLDGEDGGHKHYSVTRSPDLHEHREVLFHCRSVRPRPAKWPSFLKLRSGGRVYSNDTRAGFRRKATAIAHSFDSPQWRKIRL